MHVCVYGMARSSIRKPGRKPIHPKDTPHLFPLVVFPRPGRKAVASYGSTLTLIMLS